MLATLSRSSVTVVSNATPAPMPSTKAPARSPALTGPAAPDARRGSRGAPARSYEYLKDSLRSLKLNTVCEEAKCPNIGEARPRRRCRTLTRALAAADARSRLPRSAGTAIWGRRR